MQVNFRKQTQFFKDASNGEAHRYEAYVQRLCNRNDGQENVNFVTDGKQTIVANINKTTVRGLDAFLRKKIPEWTKNRSNDKILIICGAHGNPDGV